MSQSLNWHYLDLLIYYQVFYIHHKKIIFVKLEKNVKTSANVKIWLVNLQKFKLHSWMEVLVLLLIAAVSTCLQTNLEGIPLILTVWYHHFVLFSLFCLFLVMLSPYNILVRFWPPSVRIFITIFACAPSVLKLPKTEY